MLWRNYLTIGREVFRKHPYQFTEDEWDYAREFIALALLEMEEEEARRAEAGA